MGAGQGPNERASFPTYADLTETAGWTKSAPPVAGESTAIMTVMDLIRYTERAVLGQGGMGKVMLAHDARIGRDVAVKQLNGDRLAPEERMRFLREARVQGQLEHPSIVPVYDIDQRDDGTTFFTMRRVLGRTLHAILSELRADEPLAVARYTQRELLTAFATICLTVDYAHSRGVVHRDLKPANVMLGDFGEVYVLDWGLARVLDEDLRPLDSVDSADLPPRLSIPGELLGTPLYMAPEQMAEPAVGPRADVFSLGAILFEILTLQRLRNPDAIYVPPDARPSVRTPTLDIAPELETICVRATALDPAERYPSPRALQEAIARYLEGDRDREQRTRLAAQHADRARQALQRAESADAATYERERSLALRELARALALDPTNMDHAGTLATTLATPPHVIPAEVHEELRIETQRVAKSGTNHAVIGMLAWFLFLPFILAIGVRDRADLLMLIAAAGLGAALSIIGALQKEVGRGIQIAIMVATLFAATVTSRLFGPLILMPTLLVSFTITIQSHPWRWFRRAGLAAAVLAMAAPVLLEAAGILPSSYAFEGGRWFVEPQIVALSARGTTTMLAFANVAMLVVPCMFIARLRADLSAIQTRQLLQKWQFRQLA